MLHRHAPHTSHLDEHFEGLLCSRLLAGIQHVRNCVEHERHQALELVPVTLGLQALGGTGNEASRSGQHAVTHAMHSPSQLQRNATMHTWMNAVAARIAASRTSIDSWASAACSTCGRTLFVNSFWVHARAVA
jgi:hypothetical protein